MSQEIKRESTEKIFLWLFFPVIISLYLVYKFPTLFVPIEQVSDTFYFFGKSTSFWYATIYTAIVCYFSLMVIIRGINPYSVVNKPISTYQKAKFSSIFLSQLIVFYLIPFIIPTLQEGREFFNDPYHAVNKDAYVYVYNGFTSIGGMIYIFVIVPVLAWLFGKRYCSWFCACGNLSESVGVSKWGQQWVRNYTPRSKIALKLEWLQFFVLIFVLCYGLVLFLDIWQVFISPSLKTAMQNFQIFVIDFMFGAIIGIGAYPLLGTRIWCRYGCPLAQLMKLFGKFSLSQARIKANLKCRGIGECSKVCPMGIDVKSFAHLNKQPIEGIYGLTQTPCISCGSCVAACPTNALEFKTIFS
ncbi:4Fe-4S binding protein [Thiotrichales bacterium HSG1]|nr:4Fe-4S binding protein [Thiotrichales bacterium HSG1]